MDLDPRSHSAEMADCARVSARAVGSPLLAQSICDPLRRDSLTRLHGLQTVMELRRLLRAERLQCILDGFCI